MVQMAVEYVFSAALASDPGNPAGFKQAMESAEAENWKEGMITELQNFVKRKVYKLEKRNKVPRGKMILKTRWVLRTKLKDDGSKIYRSRVVVRGVRPNPRSGFYRIIRTYCERHYATDDVLDYSYSE